MGLYETTSDYDVGADTVLLLVRFGVAAEVLTQLEEGLMSRTF